MYNIAKLKDYERGQIFRNTASKMKVSEAIIEKDFWVVLALDYLFNKSKFKEAFTFKGGTSLSKGYALIKRFSEDIDLILDWTLLGIPQGEPYEDRSSTKQNKLNRVINEKAASFIKNKLLDEIKNGLSNILGFDVDMKCDETEGNIIISNILGYTTIIQF